MRLRFLASLLVTVVCGPARAEKLPIPVCARPAVLRHVADALRQAGRPLALEPSTVGEVSTGPAGFVRCAVRTHTLGYDTNRYAYTPLDQSEIVEYTLELRRNGIFLHID